MKKEMLFFYWNGGGHGDYRMSFVYPISDANPFVYHYVEGELQNTKKQFSDFVFQSVTNSIDNIVRRIKFDAKKIDEYQLKTQFLCCLFGKTGYPSNKCLLTFHAES